MSETSFKTNKKSLLITGHRGAKGLAPENSLAAIQKALDLQVDEIEVDVRVTKDHIPFLNHDQSVHDASGNSLKATDYTFQELLIHKPELISLEAALTLIDKKVPLLMDVKPEEEIKPIVQLLERFLHDSWRPSDFILSSFSFKTLRELHFELPVVPTAVLERWSGVRASYRARKLNTKRLNMNSLWLWNGFIRAMHNSGYQLFTYTLNNPQKAKRWHRHGLMGVITDFPNDFIN